MTLHLICGTAMYKSQGKIQLYLKTGTAKYFGPQQPMNSISVTIRHYKWKLKELNDITASEVTRQIALLPCIAYIGSPLTPCMKSLTAPLTL